jgi:hypothetical protein
VSPRFHAPETRRHNRTPLGPLSLISSIKGYYSVQDCTSWIAIRRLAKKGAVPVSECAVIQAQ